MSHLLRALETFQALGIHFVSLDESLDTSTPPGEMVFTILGIVADCRTGESGPAECAGPRNAAWTTGEKCGFLQSCCFEKPPFRLADRGKAARGWSRNSVSDLW